VREGRPLLHTTVGLGPGEAAWLPPVAPRAYASTVHIGADADVLTAEDAVRLPLAGGWVTTAWGTELHRVVRAADGLTPGVDVRGTA
jgi:urease accessory protein